MHGLSLWGELLFQRKFFSLFISFYRDLFRLRFVVSGVSPAVVVPLMIDLEKKRLGVAKNIPTLVIAASCIDNIVAITGHSLLIGIVFNKGLFFFS